MDELPLDDCESRPEDDKLGLTDPEPENEVELETVLLGVHDGE
jgi:hypothetical protein